MAEVEEYAVKYGKTGYVNRQGAAQHNIGSDAKS